MLQKASLFHTRIYNISLFGRHKRQSGSSRAPTKEKQKTYLSLKATCESLGSLFNARRSTILSNKGHKARKAPDQEFPEFRMKDALNLLCLICNPDDLLENRFRPLAPNRKQIGPEIGPPKKVGKRNSPKIGNQGKIPTLGLLFPIFFGGLFPNRYVFLFREEGLKLSFVAGRLNCDA